ncbi:MAG: hypothetical protein MZV64_68300 [Ignavibacteriales bacterium]|nr:hypothetical protein [Ignavibacteriales bacterium]
MSVNLIILKSEKLNRLRWTSGVTANSASLAQPCINICNNFDKISLSVFYFFYFNCIISTNFLAIRNILHRSASFTFATTGSRSSISEPNSTSAFAAAADAIATDSGISFGD